MATKNRRKKIRKIIVENIQYYWGVTDFDCDGDYGSRFIIWQNKVEIYNELIHGEIITPKIVREKILKHIPS